jgi:hypothetical protein
MYGTTEAIKPAAQIGQNLRDDRANFLRHTFFKQFFGVGYLTSPVSDEIDYIILDNDNQTQSLCLILVLTTLDHLHGSVATS